MPSSRRTSTVHGNTIHGFRYERLYSIWANILNRCNNPSNLLYQYYGGRGISVSAEFLRYLGFRAHLLAIGWTEDCELSVDRIDNERGYCPGNLRLATRIEQCRNRRSNRLVKMSGEDMTLAEAVERFSVVAPSTVRQRIYGYGWTVEAALLTPAQKRTKREANHE